MPEQLLSYALSTVQRIKDRISITNADFDILISRLLNGATDFIEGQCNRKFKEATHTNEIYSVHARNQEYVLLKQAPVSTVTSAQYRAGTPSNPNWTNFIADEYELLEDGKSGIVRIYGNAPYGINAIRFSYTSGYKIDFANAGNTTLHTLPFDLSELVERLVVRTFKRRDSEGKTSEGFEGAQVNWGAILDAEGKDVLDRYRRVPTFV